MAVSCWAKVGAETVFPVLVTAGVEVEVVLLIEPVAGSIVCVVPAGGVGE